MSNKREDDYKRRIYFRNYISNNSVSGISSQVYTVDNEEHSGGSLEFVIPRDLADGFINNKRESYRFRFLKVFDQATNQEEIFETIAKPVADNVLAGYNGTIFAYGQTGSGKTFTITGGAERYSDRGIIPRTLSYLYQHFTQDSSMVYTTQISYLEIYNEVGYDLLDPRHEASNLEDLPKVTIMEDPDQNIHLKNLSLQASANEEEALNLLFLGDTNRMIAETPMNQASTRSHCIFTIHLCGREPGSATLHRSKLHLVDLAGSERVGKSGVGGQILTEAKYINLSLHYLEQVITALSEKNRSHIPYRNSMMTSVLRDSLGGNCMTTMIATVSSEKTNIDESISTCRFAQRVALIKNEALVNEELDPALLIVRLKKEIQCLKEELAMVTGEQRTDELSQEEIQRIEEQVKLFLDDPDPDTTLDLGPDMRKIHHCFLLLKERVQQKQQAQNIAAEASALSSSGLADRQASEAQGDLLKLKDILTQRDNEISILVNMLKKEKRKVQEVSAQFANFSRGDLTCHSTRQSSTSIHDEKRLKSESSDYTHAHQLMIRQSGPELSIEQQEAFEIFRNDHGDRLTLEDNKAILKQRFAEAKALGEQVNQARNRVNELKKQLQMRRMQMAAQGVMESQPNPQSDTVEETLRSQIEEEKKNYKSTFGRLKGLKTEIEHLQHLLQRSKIKLKRDFQDWWSQEATRLQKQDEGSERAKSSDRQENSLCIASTRNAYSHDHIIDMQDIKQRDLSTAPARDLRALSSTTMSSTSIPLTGDHQTDADILAFIRARQSLLTRTGEGSPS
ncbi:kinesin-like protein KIF6 isoform X2 [Electrophorus electricus]|uniref:kinesin-like protein KIF6 isoform X2 n=1 Tax=Electrophorus electricus TaxID=8005 RepID=UPI0015D00568|nr:kinesin-like protein KIF6 isoform X2 [Electrophorus electricus]